MNLRKMQFFGLNTVESLTIQTFDRCATKPKENQF